MASLGNAHKAELNDAQTLTAETLRSNKWLLMEVTGDVKNTVWVRRI